MLEHFCWNFLPIKLENSEFLFSFYGAGDVFEKSQKALIGKQTHQNLNKIWERFSNFLEK